MCSALANILPHNLTALCFAKAADLNVLYLFIVRGEKVSAAE